MTSAWPSLALVDTNARSYTSRCIDHCVSDTSDSFNKIGLACSIKLAEIRCDSTSPNKATGMPSIVSGCDMRRSGKTVL